MAFKISNFGKKFHLIGKLSVINDNMLFQKIIENHKPGNVD